MQKRIKIKRKKSAFKLFLIYSHFYYRIEDQWDKDKRYLHKKKKK